MHRRGIRHLTFQGGEPLLHPAIELVISDARSAGMRVGLITNGWLLPQHVEPMANAGLGLLFVSIDSHSMDEHERNRGLPGLGARIREGLAKARRLGITTLASVAVNRLVDFERLPSLLLDLGFEGVNFSYPRRNEGSSPLAFGVENPLTDYSDAELVAVFEAIKAMKRKVPVVNPWAGVEEMERRVRGEDERFFCVGGYKYFCLDWNLDIWRCEAWPEPLGSVFDLDHIPDQRDPCRACMISCYRDGSVLMHAGIVMDDAATALANVKAGGAISRLFRRTFYISLAADAEQLWLIARLRRRPSRPSFPPLVPGSVKRRSPACIILVPDERGLVPVFGIPAVRRLVILARRANLAPLRLLGRVDLVRDVLGDLLCSDAFVQAGDGSDLGEGVRELGLAPGTKVVVIKANQVIDQTLADLVTGTLEQGPSRCIAEDKGARDGLLYLSDVDELGPLLSALWLDGSTPPPVFSNAEPMRGSCGLPCTVDERGAKACERRLFASLASRVKSDDSFLSRHVNRHISRFVSKRIVHTPLTANHITLINGAIGLAGGFFLSSGGYWQGLIGALLFLLCVIMDGADGEVARLKLQESSFGQSLDYAVDNVVHVAVFAGIAVGLYRGAHNGLYLLALLLLLAGFGLCALVVYRHILKRTPDELKRSPLAIRLMATLLTNRDFAYLVLAFAVIGRLNWFLWATALGTYLFAAVLWLAAISDHNSSSHPA